MLCRFCCDFLVCSGFVESLSYCNLRYDLRFVFSLPTCATKLHPLVSFLGFFSSEARRNAHFFAFFLLFAKYEKQKTALCAALCPFSRISIIFASTNAIISIAMDNQNKPLPPLPQVDDVTENQDFSQISPAVPAHSNAVEEKPYHRVLRYGMGIVLMVFALVGVVTLYIFVHDVLMDDREGVETQDVQLEQYVINEPPADSRRSHVRMKPGSHPEAGYIADESVLIREREEDARFREQNGQPVDVQPKTRPADNPKPVEIPQNEEPKTAAAPVEHTPAPAVAPAQPAQSENLPVSE